MDSFEAETGIAGRYLGGAEFRSESASGRASQDRVPTTDR